MKQKDVQNIISYSDALKNGVTIGRAWQDNMTNCSVAAKQYVLNAKEIGKSTEEMVDGLKEVPKVSSVGEIALKGLSIAGNMLAFMAISKGVQLAVTAFDNYIHRAEKANEATEEAISTYEDISSEVESLKSKLSDLDRQTNELDPITDAEDIENLKAETAELEKQLAIMEEKQRIAGSEADKEAQKSLGMTQASRYKTVTTYDGFAGVEMQETAYVTKDEELLNAIAAYDEYKNKVDAASQALADMSESDKYTKKEWDAQNEIVSEYSKKMKDARSHANKLAQTINEQKTALNGDTEASKNLIASTDNAIDKYNEWLGEINGTTDALAEQAKAASDVGTSKEPKWNFSATIEKLDTVKEKLDILDKTYAKLYDSGASIRFEDYSSITEAFKDVEGLNIDSYVKQLQDAGQDAGQVRSVIGSLIDEYLGLSGVLDNVHEGNQKLITSFLEEKGIANANEIVTAELAAQQLHLKLNMDESTDSICRQVSNLLEQEHASGLACSALYNLVAEETVFSATDLGVSGKIMQLSELAQAFGITADSIHSAQAYIDAARFAGRYGGKASADAVLQDMDSYYQDKIAEKFGSIDAIYNGNPNTPKASGPSGKSQKEAEKDILSDLNSEMDKYQSKLKAVRDARETYNRHGRISLDQAQDILDADFKLLAAYGDEEAALESLGKAKLNEMQIQLARNAIHTINSITTEAAAVQYLAGANENLADATLDATEQALKQAVAFAKTRGDMQGAAAETILQGYQNGAQMLAQVDFSFDPSKAEKTAKNGRKY